MSTTNLTTVVKTELRNVAGGSIPLRAIELSALLRFAGGLHTISGRIAVEVELDDQDLATRVRRDISEIYGLQSEGRLTPAASGEPTYTVRVVEEGETLARQSGLLDGRRRPIRGLPNRLTTGNLHELAAVWRGAFLAAGSLTDPGRQASIDIVAPTNEAAMALVGAAHRLNIPAKAREVRGIHRVVIRDDDAISGLLKLMGSVESISLWEELRTRREVRATANRLVNFDDANLRRSAQAAVAACARVERALEILGSDIPDHLMYAGQLRLSHREASLDELGHFADPPMTKDAVAGRIRRLLALADKTAKDRGIPGTEASLPDDLDVS